MNDDTSTRAQAAAILDRLGVSLGSDGTLVSYSPIDGAALGAVSVDDQASIDRKAAAAANAFTLWRATPAPRRGELIRLFGDVLRENKDALGRLVTLEAGKLLSEGLGEVQEMIDVCDFAVGLSRQLYGLTIASERPGHRMMETWHPAGPLAVVSAFNFPVAVWAWNFAIAIVCGDSVVWKPSEKTPLTALACTALFAQAALRFRDAPDGLCGLVLGGREAGAAMVLDRRFPIVSATGSTAMGREVAKAVAPRFARAILELGGNNAAIVAPSADLELARRAIVFSAVGTAGQRCTTLRRVFVHDDVYDRLVATLINSYGSLTIGDPRDRSTLVGPLIDAGGFDAMQARLGLLRDTGARVHGGQRATPGAFGPDAYYVNPALVELDTHAQFMREETFAPILHVFRYTDLDAAIALQNDVPQGLSSCIFTRDLTEAERFLSAAGSDCGIANVNIGPSGAEIGGAFGGEKDTGGGRESGSDAWKGYMRRQTATVNYSNALPLAQGVSFDV